MGERIVEIMNRIIDMSNESYNVKFRIVYARVKPPQSHRKAAAKPPQSHCKATAKYTARKNMGVK